MLSEEKGRAYMGGGVGDNGKRSIIKSKSQKEEFGVLILTSIPNSDANANKYSNVYY